MSIVYVISEFYPETSVIRLLGTHDTEAEARSYCETNTRNTGDRKAMKIVRQQRDAASGDVLAFYMRGIEVPYEETIR